MDEVLERELPKVKKSVALSGVVAGDTAICSVGRAGNDLYYRGYDVIALAEHATFEEVAHFRGGGLSVALRPSAQSHPAQSVQEETQDLAWTAGAAATDAGESSRLGTPDGCPAQRLFGPWHDPA